MPDNPYQPPSSDPQVPTRGVCPCCGSEDPRAGTVAFRASIGQTGMSFTPNDWPIFRLRGGLGVEADACRVCGYISLFVAEKDMGILQSE